MKKHLIFKDDKSDKFWSIETTGTSFTVAYGKTGAEGQTSTKDFGTEEKCLKEAEKLVNEKLKKGYSELIKDTDSIHDSIQNTNNIVVSNNFYSFLKMRVKDFDNSKYGKGFQKCDWNKEAEKIFYSVCSYWKELIEKQNDSIGIFDIRWDDAATQHCIEFDYDVVTNNPETAMAEGSVHNKPVIDFSDFIKKHLKENPEGIADTMGEDYSILQDILCRLAQEVILLTTSNQVY